MFATQCNTSRLGASAPSSSEKERLKHQYIIHRRWRGATGDKIYKHPSSLNRSSHKQTMCCCLILFAALWCMSWMRAMCKKRLSYLYLYFSCPSLSEAAEAKKGWEAGGQSQRRRIAASNASMRIKTNLAGTMTRSASQNQQLETQGEQRLASLRTRTLAGTKHKTSP